MEIIPHIMTLPQAAIVNTLLASIKQQQKLIKSSERYLHTLIGKLHDLADVSDFTFPELANSAIAILQQAAEEQENEELQAQLEAQDSLGGSVSREEERSQETNQTQAKTVSEPAKASPTKVSPEAPPVSPQPTQPKQPTEISMGNPSIQETRLTGDPSPSIAKSSQSQAVQPTEIDNSPPKNTDFSIHDCSWNEQYNLIEFFVGTASAAHLWQRYLVEQKLVAPGTASIERVEGGFTFAMRSVHANYLKIALYDFNHLPPTTRFQDLMRQTGVLVRKLKWSLERQTAFLQEKFNKTAKIKLSDREMEEFYNYLFSLVHQLEAPVLVPTLRSVGS